MATIAKEEKIKCPDGLGEKTRADCENCNYCSLGDCPPGAYFALRPDERKKYEGYLVKSDE